MKLYEFLTGLFLVVSFFFFVFYAGRPFEPFECSHNRKMLDDSISGIVIKKEKDSFYSSSERITVEKPRDAYAWEEHPLFVWEDDFYDLRGNAFYHEITIGDSIVKETGNLTLEIHKPDTTLFIDLSFPCKETD